MSVNENIRHTKCSGKVLALTEAENHFNERLYL